MRIALIKGRRGIERLSGVDQFLMRLFKELQKSENPELIYGNGILPVTFGLLPFRDLGEFDIIHAGAPELAASVFGDIPIITTFYDAIMCKPRVYLEGIQSRSDFLKISLNKAVLRYLIGEGLRKSKKVVAISNDAKLDAIKFFNVQVDKVTCIPPGIDTSKFKRKMGRRKKTTRIVLFFYGSIGFRKGADIVIRALDLIRKEIDAEVWFSGPVHPLFPWGRLIQDCRNKDSIKYLGWVSEEKLINLLNTADIFVMPSRAEGFGMTVLEALACGMKVVCSEMPSSKQVRNFVTIVEPNPRSLADGVLRFSRDNISLAQKKKVWQFIDDNYSLRVTTSMYVKLYKQLKVR